MLQGFEPIVEGYSKAPRDLQAFSNGVRVTVETTELFVYGKQGGPKSLTLGRQSPPRLENAALSSYPAALRNPEETT